MNEVREQDILEVPSTITKEWIASALDKGAVSHNGKALFVRLHMTGTP